MRIALSADPFIPVPPENYGGIERVINFLAEGLVAHGHQVLLAAAQESKVNVPVLAYPAVTGSRLIAFKRMMTINRLCDWKPDVMHSFSRLAYLLPVLSRKIPKIMSYQREPTISQINKALLLSPKGTLTFTGCSDYISNQIKPVANVRTIYNGVELAKYSFNESVDANAPLIVLGRVEPIKGTHHAVKTALLTGRRLIIAGNIPNEHMPYYRREIQPFLGNQIEYVGPVNDYQKNALLREALAMLMPVDWNEPFGIVMPEAMACGTPVIGFNRGAVPEVIRSGYSGILCENTEEMITAVQSAAKINRLDVREHCATHFSSEVIVDNYINLYRSVVLN
jgi:glycosyltransferase involved in cell wall biosynthesis